MPPVEDDEEDMTEVFTPLYEFDPLLLVAILSIPYVRKMVNLEETA